MKPPRLVLSPRTNEGKVIRTYVTRAFRAQCEKPFLSQPGKHFLQFDIPAIAILSRFDNRTAAQNVRNVAKTLLILEGFNRWEMDLAFFNINDYFYLSYISVKCRPFEMMNICDNHKKSDVSLCNFLARWIIYISFGLQYSWKIHHVSISRIYHDM